eukprot:CAMPEP_0184292074 /NCGR_PEP_ID=MMETSP1049-20130417/3928_1 /TAXON_ID=77928 /ORGANISM="Proteomonas sulcata, Strain CCMP704" /LENGTH=72 /DNA_ID=CAMNT_0026599713 /DNA_START=49 /DNA_END=267 /DNA_ORIENTATION=-
MLTLLAKASKGASASAIAAILGHADSVSSKLNSCYDTCQVGATGSAAVFDDAQADRTKQNAIARQQLGKKWM